MSDAEVTPPSVPTVSCRTKKVVKSWWLNSAKADGDSSPPFRRIEVQKIPTTSAMRPM